MDYEQAGLASQDKTFRLRVQVAMFVAAQQIVAEAEDEPNHELRWRLAQEVLVDPARRVGQFAWLAATNASIAETVKVNSSGVQTVDAPDGDIQFVVNANWDNVAGWPTR